MMSKMKPEDMERMAKMAADMGMGPSPSFSGAGCGMPTMTPEMIKQASSMMANMTPEDMKRMQEMASSMGMKGSGTGPGPSVSGWCAYLWSECVWAG